MAVLTTYKTASYKDEYKKIFSGVYNDFRNRAASDYNFELPPVDYEKFIKSIEDGLLNCIILLEDNIPTAFLVYTTLISESLELNIIHCIGNENINEKRKLLLEKFLELNKPVMREKVVTYPMLGKQNSFSEEIKSFGFKTVNTSVMKFDPANNDTVNNLKSADFGELPRDYSLTGWKIRYSKDVADIIHHSFKHTSDALFDSRFLSVKGSRDILEKITESIYGEFLPESTKILLYKSHPVGFCFANMTNEKTANIPLVGILKHHRHSGFGKIMLKNAIEDILRSCIASGTELSEINASCDSDNYAAVKMYNSVGFMESFTYAQAFRPKG